MIRAKKYPEDTLGAYWWLKYSVLRYLREQHRQDRGGSRLKPDIFRVLSLCEAETIIENILVELEREMDQKSGRGPR